MVRVAEVTKESGAKNKTEVVKKKSASDGAYPDAEVALLILFPLCISNPHSLQNSVNHNIHAINNR